jgi:hypothetical protein
MFPYKYLLAANTAILLMLPDKKSIRDNIFLAFPRQGLAKWVRLGVNGAFLNNSGWVS